jgi:hypothetical protein
VDLGTVPELERRETASIWRPTEGLESPAAQVGERMRRGE